MELAKLELSQAIVRLQAAITACTCANDLGAVMYLKLLVKATALMQKVLTVWEAL